MNQLHEILLEEPRLFGLLDKAARVKLTLSSHEREEYWYKIIKPRFIKLVGFEAEKEDSRDCNCYDVVYQYFIKLLEI